MIVFSISTLYLPSPGIRALIPTTIVLNFQHNSIRILYTVPVFIHIFPSNIPSGVGLIRARVRILDSISTFGTPLLDL